MAFLDWLRESQFLSIESKYFGGSQCFSEKFESLSVECVEAFGDFVIDLALGERRTTLKSFIYITPFLHWSRPLPFLAHWSKKSPFWMRFVFAFEYDDKKSMVYWSVGLRHWDFLEDIFLFAFVFDAPLADDLIKGDCFFFASLEALFSAEIRPTSFLISGERVVEQAVFHGQWVVGANRWQFYLVLFWFYAFLWHPSHRATVFISVVRVVLAHSRTFQGVSHGAVKIICVFCFANVAFQSGAVSLHLHLPVSARSWKIGLFGNSLYLVEDCLSSSRRSDWLCFGLGDDFFGVVAAGSWQFGLFLLYLIDEASLFGLGG